MSIEGSNIRQVSDDRREGHLLSLMGFTSAPEEGSSQRLIDPVFVGFTLSAYLAWRDIEGRRSDILPQLPELLDGCDDFHWTLQARDTQLSPSVAVHELLEAAEPLWDLTNTTQRQAPFAIAGNLFSSITQQVTTLATGLEIPQISGTATSLGLENSDGLFSRTIPTNAQDAKAVMTYYNSMGVKRMATIFINDPYGVQFNKALKEEAIRLDIELVFFPIERDTSGTVDIDKSMQALKQSQAKYIFAIVLEGDWKDVVQSAHKHELIGQTNPDYSWMVPELVWLLDPSFALDRNTEANIAQAMHGLAMINLHMVSNTQELFDQAFAQLSQNITEQQEFVAKTAHPELFANFSFSDVVPPFLYHHLIYDSVIALGLAACNTPGLFTGPELFAQLLQTSFEGLSGPVSFHSRTGTRTALSTQYQVSNLLLSDTRSTASQYKLDAAASALIQGDQVTVQVPFVYANNSTLPPEAMPPLQHNYHMIPLSMQVVGLCMGGAVVFLSLVLMLWTLWNRNKFIVSAAQPVFLIQLTVGTLVMALAVLPLTLAQGVEEDSQAQQSLDQACMSIPWLLFLGFVISVSAVLSKTWRLQKLMGGAEGMRRIKVETRDVMKPFLLLFVWNVIMLAGWTLVSPFQYVRTTVHNYDEFGRSTESFGRCECPNNWVFLFAGLACAANFCGVLFGCYVCYKVRDVTVYFSETSYLSISMASLFETSLLGGPLLLATRDNPPAFYIMATILICLCCLFFLIPIFAYKFQKTESTYRDAKRDSQRKRALGSFASRRSIEASAGLRGSMMASANLQALRRPDLSSSVQSDARLGDYSNFTSCHSCATISSQHHGTEGKALKRFARDHNNHNRRVAFAATHGYE